MSGNSIPILNARQFSSLDLINLQRVSMSRCGLTQVDGHAFAGLTNMVELDLSSNQLQEVNKFLDKATACCSFAYTWSRTTHGLCYKTKNL